MHTTDRVSLPVPLGRSEVQSVYERIAPIYDAFAILAESRARRRCIELAAIRDGEAVLEVATPKVVTAQATLHAERVVVCTNQSGIGRGLFDMGMLNAIHEKMHKALAQAGGRLDAIFFCPHTADSRCECRKPKAGMLIEIGKRFNVELTGVPCIGDSLRDLQAAEAVGAQPMLVLTGKGEKTLRDGNFPKNTVIFPDLAFAASALLAGDG